MPRTFIAITLAEPVIAALLKAQEKLAAVGADARWVDRDNLHLTMKFLGQVDDRHVNEVCDLAARAAGAVEPFDFDVCGLEAVPPSGQLRMVWAGIEEPTGRLERLHDELDTLFAGLGFQEENRLFRPHLTLGRLKTGKNVPQLRSAVREFHNTDFGVSPADELVVFSSQLTSEGPIYTPLTTIELSGGPE